MIGLQKRQEIERRQDELQKQQRELERISEKERLKEELLTAKSVKKSSRKKVSIRAIKKSLLDRHGNSLLIVKPLTLQSLRYPTFTMNPVYS